MSIITVNILRPYIENPECTFKEIQNKDPHFNDPISIQSQIYIFYLQKVYSTKVNTNMISRHIEKVVRWRMVVIYS